MKKKFEAKLLEVEEDLKEKFRILETLQIAKTELMSHLLRIKPRHLKFAAAEETNSWKNKVPALL